jgi:predicted nucleotidyltransferase
MNREQEKKDAEVRREREERRVAEKENQGRLEDLQTKLERLLKEKEKDYKDSVELRVREVQQRYEAELDKLNDQYSKLENDTYKKAQSIKLMEIERHQCDLRIVELTEALKSEKTTNDRNIEAINREKECDIQKITDEVQQLRQEMTRAE